MTDDGTRAAGDGPAGTDRPTRQVVRGRVVTPGSVVDDGVVVVDGPTIVWVGPASGAPVEPAAMPGPTGSTVLPGLVDLHCHGGGGAGFPDVTDAAEARAAAREHLAHGTTTLVGSLVTADASTLLARTELLAGLVASGDLAGIHLEGPFLSAARCGAQDPALMVPGDAGLVREVARLARGGLFSMTVAPEVAGVLGDGGVLEALVAEGAVPSVGHTDAPAELVEAALEQAARLMAPEKGRAGVRGGVPTVTHLFNGMPPMHHRSPGPVAAGLSAAARGTAVVELVADGVHLAPATVKAVFDLVGRSGVALVTDAIAATGMPDGEYRLGTHAVRVAGGEARLSSGGALAGSTAHLIDVVRATVAAGVPLVDAVRAASATPARVLGRADVGALEAGRRADLLVVDDDLRPLQVTRAGRPAP